MDYEKKYNEALRLAKSYYGPETNEFLDAIFPELAESEDERIRKRLVEFFEGYYDRFASRNNVNVHWEGLEVKKIIAYLEKQKEQKDSTPVDIAAAYQMGQKPAEWSEEDSDMICEIIDHCIAIPYIGGTLHLSDERKKELKNFQKSLRPQPHWKPSEEQMGALNYAYGELFKRQDVGHNILNPLQNLIDTLSKLL